MSVIGCSQQIVVELEGRDGDIDEQQMEQALNSVLMMNVSVSSRQGRFDADKEVLVRTRDSIITSDNITETVNQVRQEIISQNLGFEVSEWRVEAV